MKIVKLQKLTISFATGDTSKTGTLTGFTSAAKIFPFSASADITGDSNLMTESFFDVDIVSNTSISVSRGGTGKAAVVIVYVVEVDPDTTVEKKTWAIGTGATTDDVAITSAVMAETFIVPYNKSATATAQQPIQTAVGCDMTTTTNVRMVVNTSGSDHSGTFYVVTNSNLSVQRGTKVLATSPETIAVTSVVEANTFVIASNTGSGVQYEDESGISVRLSSATGLEVYAGYTTVSASVYWQVVTATDFSVQRFNLRNSAAATGTFTLTAVDLALTAANGITRISSGSSSEYDDAWDLSCRATSYDLDSTTNITWSNSSQNGSAYVEAVEFTLYVAPSNPGAGMTMVLVDKKQTTAALENPSAFTFSKSDEAWGAISIALKLDTSGGVGGTNLATTSQFKKIETTGTVTVKNTATVNGLTVTGDLVLTELQNITGVTVSGTLTLSVAGTYSFTACTIGTIVNTSGGNITVNMLSASTIDTNTGPNITVNNSKAFNISINPNVTGYEWRVYTVSAIGSLSGAVEIAGEESATTNSHDVLHGYTSQAVAVQIIDSNYVEATKYYTLEANDLTTIIDMDIETND